MLENVYGPQICRKCTAVGREGSDCVCLSSYSETEGDLPLLLTPLLHLSYHLGGAQGPAWSPSSLRSPLGSQSKGSNSPRETTTCPLPSICQSPSALAARSRPPPSVCAAIAQGECLAPAHRPPPHPLTCPEQPLSEAFLPVSTQTWVVAPCSWIKAQPGPRACFQDITTAPGAAWSSHSPDHTNSLVKPTH